MVRRGRGSVRKGHEKLSPLKKGADRVLGRVERVEDGDQVVGWTPSGGAGSEAC